MDKANKLKTPREQRFENRIIVKWIKLKKFIWKKTC